MLSLALPLGRRLVAPLRGFPPSVYIQLTASFINRAGGATKVFLPLLLLERYGLSYASIGLLLAGYGAGALCGAYLGGYLSDRYDPCRLSVASLALGGVFTAAIALPLPLAWTVALLPLTGLFEGAFRPANTRLTLEPCTPAQRPLAHGMHRTALNLGFAIAGVSGGLLAAFGYHWIYALQGATALLAALWMAWAYRRYPLQLPTQRTHDAAEESGQSPWQDGPFLAFLGATLLANALFDQMFGTLTLFLRQDYGLPPQWPGYLQTLNALLVFALQLPLSARIGRWGLVRCALAGTLLLALSPLPLVLGHGAGAAVTAMTLFTLGEIVIAPTFAAIVMVRSEGRLRGRYLGLFAASWSATPLFSPALGTWVYGHFGGATLWWGASGVVALSLLWQALTLRQMRRDTPQLR